MQTAETVEAIVSQLMEKQRVARQAALVKQLECGCPDSTCADGKSCSHPMRRITAAKTDMSPSPLPSSSTNSRPPSNSDGSNQVSSTTGSGSLLLQNNHSPRVYSRDSRNHHGQSSSRQCSSSNSANTPPLVLSLSQIQGGGGLLILNSNSNNTTNASSHQQLVSPVSVASFVCNTNNSNRKNEVQPKGCHMVLKQEAMDTNQTACVQSPLHNTNNTIPQRSAKMDVSNENIRQSVYDTLNCNNQARRNSITHSSHHSEVIMSSAPATPSKRMETNHEEEYKQQNACADNVVVLGTEHINKRENSSLLSNNFFNETLDLSQEDIQRTLSANMPLCSTDLNRHQRHESTTENRRREIPNKPNDRQQNNTITHEINPMDFINNCDVVVSPTHVVDDDVFVNLDAFDMLGEFPDLEVLDSGHHGLLDVNPSDDLRNEKSSAAEQTHGNVHPDGTAKITDYSPEWAYPEGGVKVLVTGPWHSAGPYTVLFDTFPVPTTLVQSGVLRCYCPGIYLQFSCGILITKDLRFST